MKKALLIKLESQAYSSVAIVKAFREHFEVRDINWMGIRFNSGNDFLKNIWDAIIKECDEFKPDLIWCHLQVDYILSTEQFKELGKRAFVINYTEDVREDIKWMEDAAPHIGLTVFTNQDDVDNLKLKGIFNVAYMPVSYNDVWYRPVPKTDKYYGDIVFIGNNTVTSNLNFPYAQERQDMIKFMEDKFGDKFRAYGMGQTYQMLPPAEVLQAYNNCKIVITQNQFKKRGYESDRGLIAMACGALTIHQYFEWIENIFDEQRYFYWKEFEDLYGLCANIILNIDMMPREWVGKKELCAYYTKENHSWHKRIIELIYLIKTEQWYSGLEKLGTQRKDFMFTPEQHRESELYHYNSWY